ncbi:hypothetical protein AAF712_013703 [Marasmius tenuissimus]|uniref:Carrier domain-containing protein n=1 Tax=Marasmius tenuissimus TaxID=585030 RepID=A0ABR2ZE01_9AGAR
MARFIRPHLNLGYGDDLPTGVNDLPELIAFNATHNPDLIFGRQLRGGDGLDHHDITFGQLQRAVEGCSAWLTGSEATRGREIGQAYPAPVGIFLGSDITLFIYMAALLRIGTPVLCLSARLNSVAVAHLLKATSASTLLYTGQTSRIVREVENALKGPDITLNVRYLVALSYEEFLDDIELGENASPVPAPYTHIIRHELGAVIMHSSGTTGLPKPIYHSPGYLIGYAGCHQLSEPAAPFGYNISTLPLYHGFGLVAPSLSLSIGLPFVLPPASVIPTARMVLTTLRTNNAYSMLSVPSILEDISNSADLDALTLLKTLEFVAIGGAPMKVSVAERLVAAGVKLLNHWGATEIGAISLIELPKPSNDWHYIRPRKDLGLRITEIDASDSKGSRSCRLIGHPLGWSSPFFVQDVLARNPDFPDQLCIVGRADDLIVLANGEKICPTNMERVVAEHPQVKDVLAFGSGKPSLGLIVEVVDGTNYDGEEFRNSFARYLERGNAWMDAHGKIGLNMVVFTTSTKKALVRTDKGSLARKENYVVFEEEIREAFDDADEMEAKPLPSDGLRDALRSLVASCAWSAAADFAEGPKNDSMDFFEMGMDSLQATRLRRMIQAALSCTQLPPSSETPTLPSDFCFQYSSVDKLCNAITTILSGHDITAGDGDRERLRVEAMEAMVHKCVEHLRSYKALAGEARKKPSSIVYGRVVLLTGSTGSLGCMLLETLSADPCVRKVLCLNRPRHGGLDAIRKYQIDALKRRGVVIPPEHWDKIVFIEAQTSMDNLGLDDLQYSQLLEVTHIVHNAWPMDFNRKLDSFEPHVQTLLNLIKLCLQSPCSPPPRILFTSSIAVVGKYPSLDPGLERSIVPEGAVDARATDEFGYAEAKWVCEMVLQAANEMYGGGAGDEPLLRGSSVRIGQMTGPEGSGCWNKSEHFPMICRTSKLMKALPDIDGTLSWIPANRAAVVIRDLLFGERFRPFYHVENPVRQSWKEVLGYLSVLLAGPPGLEEPLPLVSFSEWTERVRRCSDDPVKNPALKIIRFLEEDFVRMASGKVVLGTELACEDSATLKGSVPVGRRQMEEYWVYWQSRG